MSIKLKRHCMQVLICFLICIIILLLNAEINSIAYFSETKQNHYKNADILSAVREITQCFDRPRLQTVAQIGNFTVLFNLAVAEKEHLCHESVTYSTQGDYSFLDNIVPTVKRWQGPVSVALNAPGDDFKPTLDSIAYVRSCELDLIRKFVSFHVYFERKHTPKLKFGVIPYVESYNWTWDCSKEPPFKTIKPNKKYRIKQKMEFFINVGRNIAISQAQTHFLLSADLELYPSLNIIPNFFEMLVRDFEILDTFPRRVYVLPTFESAGGLPSPKTKSELQDLYQHGKAVFFCERYCPECHIIPNKAEWLATKDNGKLAVFSNTSRNGEYKRWEPLYIGTHSEPLFQERVTWDGGSDKMVKDFVLCLLDYRMLVLDNAFIVHKPGFKKPGVQKNSAKQNMTKTILEVIVPELEVVYGKRTGCVIGGQYSQNLPNYQ